MKKIIVVLFILVIVINLREENITIPQESIRFRIIANSNDIKDQKTKMEILSEIHPIITNQSYNNYETAQESINNLTNEITPIVDKYSNDFNISYGDNYFPEKVYKGVTYQGGNYESLVIELGETKGDNWWCVLFPPLCLLEAEENQIDNTEYKLFVNEILKNF